MITIYIIEPIFCNIYFTKDISEKVYIIYFITKSKEDKMVEITSIATMTPKAVFALVLVLIWVLIWKGLALWKAAKKKSLVWFIVLLLVNTLGILEILYIFLFSGISSEKPKAKKKRK